MSMTWLLVILLGGIIFVVATFIGRIILRLPLQTSLLAAVLMLPFPILAVGDRVTYTVFAPDLVALWLLIYQIFKPPQGIDVRQRNLFTLAVVFVLLLPCLSTLLSVLAQPGARFWYFMVMQLGRSIAYLTIFRYFLYYGRRIQRPDSFLLVQCVAFVGICVAGLGQYAFNLNTDLWSELCRSEPGRRFWGFGGGFMGLYRGAAGVWGASFMAVLPIITLNRRGWSLLFPFAWIAIAFCLLAVGSRQGVVFGAIGSILGLFYALRGMPREQQFVRFFQIAVAMTLLGVGGLVVAGQLQGTFFERWSASRFAEITESRSFGDLVKLALMRDDRYDDVLNKMLDSPVLFTSGMGYGLENRTVGMGFGHIYIDSELFYFWQIGGVLMISMYLLFLLRLRMGLRRSLMPDDPGIRLVVYAGIAALYVGMMHMWGHFFLMTTQGHHAPVGYWQWALFGLAASVCTRSWWENTQPAWEAVYAGETTA